MMDNELKAEIEKRIKTLDNYIEFADARKRFSDVGVYEDIKATLESALAQLQGQWVPVWEKLPKDDGYYLIFNGVATTAMYTRADGFIGSYPVTHWQALPSTEELAK